MYTYKQLISLYDMHYTIIKITNQRMKHEIKSNTKYMYINDQS